MVFSEIDFERHPIDPEGVQALKFFDNGYGVSVVKFYGSYGWADNLYELAVLKGTSEDWEICYDTYITDDVLGYLSEERIDAILEEVESL